MEIDLFALPWGAISVPKAMRETTRSWGRILILKSETNVPDPQPSDFLTLLYKWFAYQSFFESPVFTDWR
jgi:hypothetical protein